MDGILLYGAERQTVGTKFLFGRQCMCGSIYNMTNGFKFYLALIVLAHQSTTFPDAPLETELAEQSLQRYRYIPKRVSPYMHERLFSLPTGYLKAHLHPSANESEFCFATPLTAPNMHRSPQYTIQ